jgi:1,4-dihydroxy-6-naphthoate synthase
MFHALAAGRVRVPEAELEFHLLDVEELNRRLPDSEFDVTKASAFAFLQARDRYDLLPSGAALGFGCGPLVVARGDRPAPDLLRGRYAVPGAHTTAHLLLRLWQPRAANRLFVRYDEVIPAVVEGRADFGVLIHEERFTHERAGARLVQDLGAWWEQRTGLPVPLGCVLARRTLGAERIAVIADALRRSIRDAMDDPARPLDHMRRHAATLDAAVLRRHVRTFVNEFSLDLGPHGRESLAALERLAAAAGVLP